MKKLIIIFIIIILVVGGFYLINKRAASNNISSGDKKLQVVASFYPMYFFAKEIGGEQADVFNITPASAEPHDYEPTTQDIAQIENANILVLNGGSVESWGNKIKDDLTPKTIIVVAGEKMINQEIEEEGKRIPDPHVWQSPPLAKQEVMKIEEGFEKADPTNASYYQANAKKLEATLDQIDAAFKQGLQSCQKKDFITSHAAFGYLAEHYGITQVAISGVSPDEEPSSQTLAMITDLVKKEDIKVIFFESLVSPKLSQTIANETHAQTMVLDPIEGISDDDMKAGHTYVTLMKDNLKNLQIALECK